MKMTEINVEDAEGTFNEWWSFNRIPKENDLIECVREDGDKFFMVGTADAEIEEHEWLIAHEMDEKDFDLHFATGQYELHSIDAW